MLVSNCAVCCKKKSRFIKNQEANELMSKLGIRSSLSDIPLISDTFFLGQEQLFCFSDIWNYYFKMTEAVNKFLWTGPKFMPELHIRQPGFTYNSADHLLDIVKGINYSKKRMIYTIITRSN